MDDVKKVQGWCYERCKDLLPMQFERLRGYIQLRVSDFVKPVNVKGKVLLWISDY